MGQLETTKPVVATSLVGRDMLTMSWIAPKKTKGEKMDLGTFLTDSSMLRSSRRTGGYITAADQNTSPGLMGR